MKRRTGVLLCALTLACAALVPVRDARTPVRSVSIHPPARIETPLSASRPPAHSENQDNVRATPAPVPAENDPRATFLYLKKHGSGRADAHLALSAFRQWAGTDFTAAFDEAERHPPGRVREELFGALALVVAQASPSAAAEMTERDMAPGPVRTETALSILHHWAVADLEQAARWAATFPPGPGRERAIRELEGIAVSFFPRAALHAHSGERTDGRAVLPQTVE
jgi:hypothetical protein